MPGLGGGVYLKRTMYCLASVHLGDSINQVYGFLDCVKDPVSSE
jgi:hypothetical protein